MFFFNNPPAIALPYTLKFRQNTANLARHAAQLYSWFGNPHTRPVLEYFLGPVPGVRRGGLLLETNPSQTHKTANKNSLPNCGNRTREDYIDSSD